MDQIQPMFTVLEMFAILPTTLILAMIVKGEW
jgi:hypothetical protein